MIPENKTLGHLLIVLGIALLLAGLFSAFVGKLPFLGKLPGDIHIQKKNFSFYFPLGSALVLSIILSLILNLLTRK
jgi:hypothetical protein